MLETFVRGESDRGVALLTSRGELVFAHAPTAARSRKRFGGALQPGARVRARWSLRSEGASPRLDEAVLLREPPKPDPLERYYAAAHLLEISRSFAREGSEDERSFRLLCGALERLEAGDAVDPLLRYVEAWSLRLAGQLPDFEHCAECAASLAGARSFLVSNAGAFCASHRPPAALSIEGASSLWLTEIRQCPLDAIPPLPPAGAFNLSELLATLLVDFLEAPLRVLPRLRRLQSDFSKGSKT